MNEKKLKAARAVVYWSTSLGVSMITTQAIRTLAPRPSKPHLKVLHGIGTFGIGNFVGSAVGLDMVKEFDAFVDLFKKI